MTKKQTYVSVNFGGWNNNYAVPTEKVSILLGLLDDCIKINDKSIKDANGDYQRIWYKDKRPSRISIEVMDHLLEDEPVEVVDELQSA